MLKPDVYVLRIMHLCSNLTSVYLELCIYAQTQLLCVKNNAFMLKPDFCVFNQA